MQSLSGVNPDMVAVVEKAIEITEEDFSVIEGIRSLDRQKQLLKDGKSTTLNSRHITGHAVDMVPYPVDWEDRERFHYMGGMLRGIGHQLGLKIRWGGDWDSDGEIKDKTKQFYSI